MFSNSSLCNDKDAMLRWISENVFKFFFAMTRIYAMFRWISDVFKFFFMQWQGCNVKMNKWECFQILLYAMTRMQCLDE